MLTVGYKMDKKLSVCDISSQKMNVSTPSTLPHIFHAHLSFSQDSSHLSSYSKTQRSYIRAICPDICSLSIPIEEIKQENKREGFLSNRRGAEQKNLVLGTVNSFFVFVYVLSVSAYFFNSTLSPVFVRDGAGCCLA